MLMRLAMASATRFRRPAMTSAMSPATARRMAMRMLLFIMLAMRRMIGSRLGSRTTPGSAPRPLLSAMPRALVLIVWIGLRHRLGLDWIGIGLGIGFSSHLDRLCWFGMMFGPGHGMIVVVLMNIERLVLTFRFISLRRFFDWLLLRLLARLILFYELLKLNRIRLDLLAIRTLDQDRDV